jgi:hypothetical protein
MKLEDQVTSLELSKKLKELGVVQRSVFFWHTSPIKPGLQVLSHAINVGDIHECAMSNEFSAFTVAELGEMLPRELTHVEKGYKRDYEITLKFGTNMRECWYEDDQGGYCPCNCGDYYSQTYFGDEANTEVDARAKMLVYLKENKLI